MAVPVSKSELIVAITTTFDKLMSDLAKVPKERARECTLEGHVAGTVMSPADLVSYLLGWNELVLKWLACDDDDKWVDFPDTGFKWNQLGLLAQKFYTDHRSLDWPVLLHRVTAAKVRIIDNISSKSDYKLYGKPWYGKWTMGRMIQLNTSSPYANARGRIRKWLRQTDDRATCLSAPTRCNRR